MRIGTNNTKNYHYQKLLSNYLLGEIDGKQQGIASTSALNSQHKILYHDTKLTFVFKLNFKQDLLNFYSCKFILFSSKRTYDVCITFNVFTNIKSTLDDIASDFLFLVGYLMTKSSSG